MNISEVFIRRPIATTLIMLAILIFGLVGYFQLPVSDLPNVDYPTINVSANLPGADPDTMAAVVALPLEKQFSTIPGVAQMTSTSGRGRSNITLQFDLSRDIDTAAQDVQAAIAAVRMPRDMPNPPQWRKSNPAAQSILTLALSSDTLPISTVDEYAETSIAQRISTINGVAEVTIDGATKYAVRVRVDPRALATRQIGMNEVQDQVSNGNVNAPVGAIYGHEQTLSLEATGELYHAADYAPLIVSYRNGAVVRLSDVAQVIDSVENERNADWYNGKRAIGLSVYRQPGSNTVEVVDSIKAILPQLQAMLPPGISMVVRLDRSISIRQSVNDVKFTLTLALFLVVLVIFLFLRNLRATGIPSVALPLSIVGAFAVMYLLGYSIDNFSLMALTLSVGFVVDDAIVMLENIVRHLEMGKGVLEAALEGSNEIGFTIVSITLSLAAVFIPVLFMSGLLGRLLHEFAVTIIATILVSGFVSLSLTPMLCRLFLNVHQEVKHGRLFNFFERIQDGMTAVYDSCLKVALRFRIATMVVSVLLLVGTVYLYQVVPKGFLPTEDDGVLNGTIEAVQGVSFEVLSQKVRQVAELTQNHPAVAYVLADAGAGNTGGLNIQLKPHDERPPIDDVLQDLRRKLSVVPGVNVFLQHRPQISVGGFRSKALYQLTLQSQSTVDLYNAANMLVARLASVPEVSDPTNDVQVSNPQIKVTIDREKAATLGVTASQIEDTLGSSYGQRQVSTIMAPNNQYQVILEVAPEYQRDPEALSSLYIRAQTGQLVLLSSVAKLEKNLGPLQVTHLGQIPSATVSFNLAPGVSIGQAVDIVDNLARTALPASVTYTFQGTAQAFQTSLGGIGLLLVMSLVVIYIVLGILYESFIHPLTILYGLPSAGFGALLALELFHLAAQKHWVSPRFDMELNIYGFIGVIMLIGIVKKNAIMMIDFALEAQRNDGKSAADAIYQGCLVRFRPIMMTTAAALMGTLPIALGRGAGGDSRRALGIAVVGGLLFSQVVTLLLTPVLYIYMDQAKDWIARLFGKRHASGSESAPASHGPVGGGGPIQSPIARSASSDRL
jgi:hydrophobic/amphiphilic exporter-1 (mainly G- bacteria), HAE1 family